MKGSRFKVYTVKSSYNATAQKIIDATPNVYMPYIPDFENISNTIYVLDNEELDNKMLKLFASLSVSVEVRRYNTVKLLHGEQVDTRAVMYVDECEVAKFCKTISAENELKVGDYVRVRRYNKLPFRVDEVCVNSKTAKLSHVIKSVKLELDTSFSSCEKVDKDSCIFYKTVKKRPLTKTIFIDCDIYTVNGVESTTSLLEDMLLLKIVFSGYKIIALNPLCHQSEFLKVLGVEIGYGNKRVLIYDSKYSEGVDLLYTNDVKLLECFKRILLTISDKSTNLSIPKIVTRETVCEELEDKFSSKSFKINWLGTHVELEDTDIKEIKKYFKDNYLLRFVGDVPYYLDLIKN